MIQIVRALLAFFVLGLSQAVWIGVCVVASVVVTLGGMLVSKMRELIDRYLVHLLAIGTLAFVSFLIAQATCNAEQNERLRSVENAASILHVENREDHKRIEQRLDVLLERTPANKP